MTTTAQNPALTSGVSRECRKKDALVWSALICIVLLHFCFCIGPLGRGLGEDELFTAVNFVEVPSLRPTLTDLGAFNNHIGYSLAARMSEHLFGRSEESLRLPALVFGLASIVCLFQLCRLVVGTQMALVASLLLSLSPLAIAWSTEARGYSGMMCLSILSSYLFIGLTKEFSTNQVLMFVLATVAAVYIHLYSVFVIAAELVLFIYLVWRQDAATAVFDKKAKRIVVSAFIAIVIGSAVLYAPAAHSFVTYLVGRGKSAFNPLFPLVVLKYLSGTRNIHLGIVLTAIAGVGCVQLSRQSRQVLVYSLILLVGPLGSMWLMRPLDLYPRFFAYWLPFYLLLVTCGLRLTWCATVDHPGPLRQMSHLVAIAVVCAVTTNWMLTWKSWVEDEGYRDVAQAAQFGASPRTGFCAIGGSRSIWRYYIKRPIATPLSLSELQQFASGYSEVRCLYYKASWQDDEQKEIADFLFQHAAWRQSKGHVWFSYRSPKAMPRASATRRE